MTARQSTAPGSPAAGQAAAVRSLLRRLQRWEAENPTYQECLAAAEEHHQAASQEPPKKNRKAS